MREAKPVFNHKTMIETVSGVLLNSDVELRVEDLTSLLASVTEPSVERFLGIFVVSDFLIFFFFSCFSRKSRKWTTGLSI